MAEEKGIGSKLLGLFVETDGQSTQEAPTPEQGSEKSPADIVAELAGQGPGPRPAPAAPAGMKLEKLPTTQAPPADFDALFRDAGMDASELDRVRKAEELLKSLPEGTPQPVKRQIVEASLKAFGFELEKIVAAAQNQKRALDAYVRVNETATAKAISEAESQIQSLNARIAELRGDIQKRTEGLSSLSAAAQTRKGEVQKVLEFFQAPTLPKP